jgi:hypothetical protein
MVFYLAVATRIDAGCSSFSQEDSDSQAEYATIEHDAYFTKEGWYAYREGVFLSDIS